MSHQVQLEWHNDVPVMRISGKLLENEDSSALWQTFVNLPEDTSKLIIDLEGVSVMNSSGIGICLKCFTALRNKGGEVIFCSVSDSISNLLLLTKLNSIFTISADIQSALQTLNAQDA